MELPERCRTRVSFSVSPPGSPEVDISHRFRAGGSSSFRNRWEISTSQRRCLNGSRPGGKSLWSFRLFDTVGLFGKCVRASNTSDGNMAAAQATTFLELSRRFTFVKIRTFKYIWFYTILYLPFRISGKMPLPHFISLLISSAVYLHKLFSDRAVVLQ